MANLNKIVISTFILVAIFVGAMSLNSNKSQKPVNIQAAKNIDVVMAAPPESKVVSPDGKVTLTVKEKKDNLGTLWTANVDSTQVFSEILPDNISLSVPFNTFSPDNKYILLKESLGGNDSYIVLLTSGKPILNDGSTLEITKYFYAKYGSYKITDVTGWAAPTLIVVNTDKISGGQGPSFWFDVSTKSFIQLSTRFN